MSAAPFVIDAHQIYAEEYEKARWVSGSAALALRRAQNNGTAPAVVAQLQAKYDAASATTTHLRDELKKCKPTAGTPARHDPYKSLTDRTDTGNANLLIRLSDGDLRYVAETKQWLRWDGQRWQVDTHEVFVTTQAVEVARYYIEEAKRLKESGNTGQEFVDSEDYLKWASKCRNKQSLDNMITLARKSVGVPISITELDRNPWLLGVDNGVVDLKTGDLHESEAREEFVTKRSSIKYNVGAAAPRWESLIAEITGLPIAADRDANGDLIPGTVGRFAPRPALARYLQKALGYSITGSTEEQKFFLAIGEGSNGKGVIFDTVKAMLGPYAIVLPAEALMVSKHDADAERPTALAATLAGARLVVASESKEGQKLNTAMIKSHTGDRQMQARKMRENPFTFTITHKLWLLTNVRPTLDHIDAATKGRLHFTPFDRRWNRPGEAERNPALPDGDKTLMAHLLKAEAEGILAWLVRGAVMYHAEGLTPPDEVTSVTREYVLEQDSLGRWLAMMQRCAPKQGTLAAELFRQFGAWCGAEGATMDPSNANAFGRGLRSRGLESTGVTAGTVWGLRANVPLPPSA
jgi:putative DNA primase/helicase